MVVPSFDMGGVDKAVMDVAKYMSMVEDVEVHLVVFGLIPKVFHPLAGRVFVHQAPFVYDPSHPLDQSIRTMWFLRKTVRKIDPLSVLCFGEKWCSLLIMALMGLNFRVFMAERNEPALSGIFRGLAKRLIIRKVSGVIVQTRTAQELYQSLFPEKKVYQISDPFFQNVTLSSMKKENVIVTLGPLGPNNRLDELISQFKKQQMPGWKLVIIGGDSYYQHYLDKLKQTIAGLGMQDSVILAGSRLDLDRYFGVAKIFADVSTAPEISHSVGEAMSAGIPVVGFNTMAGADGLVEHGSSGLLAPKGDFDTLGLYLKQLMTYPGLCRKMGSYAQRRMNQFNLLDIGEAYYNLLMVGKSGSF
jgi:GalNAc-alpha-(1->4)-GalNAc-alpha-(1->3)-diNAcBac-PP-undecaprenol alpha-1,4-N-acetyl-D-galactosaminyltransferase